MNLTRVRNTLRMTAGLGALLFMSAGVLLAEDISPADLLQRLERLEQQNQSLRKELEDVKTGNVVLEGEQADPDAGKVQKIVDNYLKTIEKNKKAKDDAAKLKAEE